MKTFYFSAINLGCSKNLVDLEFMIGSIFNLGSDIDIKFFQDPLENKVEYVIINTCGFLSSSRDEAEKTIKKYDDAGKKIIVMGCYTEVKNDKFLSNLKNLHSVIPHDESKNLDLIFKNNNLSNIKTNLEKIKTQKIQDYLKNIGSAGVDRKAFIWGGKDVRAYFNAGLGYEFLKISEGCDNNCTFCIIPTIRGRQKSRTIEDILQEVKTMVDFGVKEIQIISQDTTRYGTDLYKKASLIDLLEKIDEIDMDFKYRIYYMYPDILTFEHLDRLKNLKKMLPYFDIPFQHISSNILKKMGRFYNEDHIYKLLDYIKINFKNAFIHTNFIVGFPGEKEEDFEKLKNFIKKYEFDSISLFGYHDEKLATSSKLSDKVDDETIKKRVQIIKDIINHIYDKKEEKRQNTIQIGYIHNIDEKNNITVRPEIKAPEIDEYDNITKKQIIKGKIGIGEKIEYKLK